MSSAKWRPFCLGLNVLKYVDKHLRRLGHQQGFAAAAYLKLLTMNGWWLIPSDKHGMISDSNEYVSIGT